MSQAYIQELQELITRLKADLESSRNDTRLVEGALAMANANIELLKAQLPSRTQLSTDDVYERREDMSPDGKLQLFIQSDGDVIVQIVSRRDDDWRMASVEFCSCGSGGGRSPRVLGALRDLARAIAADNEAAPFPKQS